jgi:CRISPR-associated endonuclease/helicase Cas3
MLDLSVMRLGKSATGAPSWSERMLPLRDRADLGPFRLGYLEATVRMADWRASARPGGSTSFGDPEGEL